MTDITAGGVAIRDQAPACAGVTHGRDAVRLGLIGFGLYELVIGAIAAAGPASIVKLADRSGAPHGQAAVERATFELPLGFALLAAVRHRSWRPPVLAVGSLNWTLRALTRISGERPRSGVIDPMFPAVGAGALAWLFSRTTRAERWATG